MASEPHIVVLLGAGSTLGAGCEPMPPGDWNFFDKKNSCVQDHLRPYPALKWGVKRFAPCSLEDLVSQTDLLAKLCASRILSEEKDYWENLEGLRARGKKDPSYAWRLAIEEPCMALPALVAPEAWSILCDVLESLNPPNTSPLATLLKVLLHRSSRLTLATLNYDLVLEKVLEKAVLQLDSECKFRYGEADPPTVEVLKLHGSLNWKEAAPDFCPEAPEWGKSGWLKVERSRGFASSLVQPSLLLPTLFKQEININYQIDRRAMYYKRLWEIFAARLSSATALLTVGCSFPDTDRHLRAVVGSAVNAGKLRRVVVCWKKDHNTSPIDRLKKVLSIDRLEVCEEAGGLKALVKGDKVSWLMKTLKCWASR